MNTRTILTLAASTALLACGDPTGSNNGNNANGATNSASNSRSTGCTATECDDPNGATNGRTNNIANGDTNNANAATNSGTGGPPELPDLLALAATADFAEGESAWHAVTASDGELSSTATDFGSGDLGVSYGTEWAYVLDRNGSQVQVLDAADLSDAGLLDVSGAVPTNPQFATDTGSKIYVSLYGTAEIVSATVDSGEFDVERLDTSMFDDADDNPEASAILADDGYVLVVLQRLESFMPAANSALLVIDSSDNSFVDFDDQTDGIQPLDLGVTNAQANIRWTGDGNIAIGATGAYGENDGAIVIVEREAAGDYSLGETFATEEDFGGDLLDFVFTGDGVGFAVISNADFSTDVYLFEEDDPLVTVAVDTFESPGYAGLDALGENFWWAAGDRGDATGFQFVEYARRPGPALSTDLPPAGFVFVGGVE